MSYAEVMHISSLRGGLFMMHQAVLYTSDALGSKSFGS